MATTWRFLGAAPYRACAARAQTFQRAKLKLLDCALRPAEFQRDVSNTFLFDETFENDGALIFRKAVHELEQSRSAFNVLPVRLVEIVFGDRIWTLLRNPSPAVRHRIRSNAIQPH